MASESSKMSIWSWKRSKRLLMANLTSYGFESIIDRDEIELWPRSSNQVQSIIREWSATSFENPRANLVGRQENVSTCISILTVLNYFFSYKTYSSVPNKRADLNKRAAGWNFAQNTKKSAGWKLAVFVFIHDKREFIYSLNV